MKNKSAPRPEKCISRVLSGLLACIESCSFFSISLWRKRRTTDSIAEDSWNSSFTSVRLLFGSHGEKDDTANPRTTTTRRNCKAVPALGLLEIENVVDSAQELAAGRRQDAHISGKQRPQKEFKRQTPKKNMPRETYTDTVSESGSSFIELTVAIIACRGDRSSCDIVARNRSLSDFACS